ncbi:MAG TPA: cation diffusion facilitator family transporter [Acidimicrobiales bacterium]|nr:cation diffusion facilitator family transporter [Acidimicrobiales bacterium]
MRTHPEDSHAPDGYPDGHAHHGPSEGHHHHEHDHGRGRGRMSSALGSILHALRPGHSHDPADRLDRALEATEEGRRALVISVVGLSVTAVIQAGVVILSGSVALLGDTLHNLADALTAVPLWIAFSMGRRPPTRRYTYGFGRAEDLAGILIVAVMAGSSIAAGWASVHRLVHPARVHHVGAVMAAAVVGFLGNEAVAVFRIRIGRRIGSAALVADGLHARTDGLTSLAVLAGAIGVMLGAPLADPIVGLVVTAAILLVLRTAARDIYRRLMDAVDPELVGRAAHVLEEVPGVMGVYDLRVRWIGHRMLAEASLEVDASLTVAEGHSIAEEAHHRLLHNLPRLSAATLHTDPSGTGHHHATAHHQALD